jgi:lysophospholipase L1-like esterase
MTLILMQKGTGATRPLVAAFGPLDPGKLPAKLGPGPCIVVDSDGHGTEDMRQVVEFAAQKSGATSFNVTALIGFSIGCSRVRALRRGGAKPSAYLLMDGTHASWPPQPWQIDWIQDIANQARAGKILVVASHTYQTYTEKIASNPFASTVTVLRQATGYPLAQGGPPNAPVITRDPVTGPPSSGLWIYSYASAEIDKAAHAYQGGPALHELAGKHLAPWLAAVGTSSPTIAPVPQTMRRALLVGDSLASGLGLPLGTRFQAAGGDFTAHAIDGSTIDQWAKGMDLAADLAKAQPLLTLVSLGTNDLAAKPAEYKAPLIAAIITRIRAAGSSVAWILPPTMPAVPDRGGLRGILAAELARLAVPAFDSTALTLPRAPDKIHPTPAGFDLWAARIMEWLSSPPATQPSTGPTGPSSGTTSPPAASTGGDLAPIAALGAVAFFLGG